MNSVMISSLSAEEIIHYVESGVLDSIDAASVIKVVDYFHDLIHEEGEEQYENGKKEGYQEAIRDAVCALNNL